jgi:hypothetical protein
MSVLTVTVPAASLNLTTLAIVKDELDIIDAAQDTRLARWISEASSQIHRWINRSLVSETVSELFPGCGSSRPDWMFGDVRRSLDNGGTHATYRLLLARFPVSSIDSVVIDDGDPLDAATYTLDGEKGVLYLPYWSGSKIVVVYTGGYALTATSGVQTMPGAVVQAATAMVCLRHAMRGRDPSLRSVDVPGVLSETYWVGAKGEDGAMPPSVTGLLEGFREVRP